MSTPDIPAGHARAATPEELTGRWRQGMSNPFSVYVQLGDEPSKEDDPFVGSLVSPEAAAEAVRAHNAEREAQREIGNLKCAVKWAGKEMDRRYEMGTSAERARFVCMEPVATTLGVVPCGRRRVHPGDCMAVSPPDDWAFAERAAVRERERIAKAAAEMATTLTRPGLGNGTAHGEQVRVVRLDELLDLINDGGEGQA